MNPSQSVPLVNYEDIKHFPSGSKLVFRRGTIVQGKFNEVYLHTGILLHVDEQTFVLEVTSFDRTARMVITEAREALRDLTNRECFVDNSYLQQGGIYINDILFRMANIHGCPVAYDCLRMNCDVIAT